MSVTTNLSDIDILNFLGSFELHILSIKANWQTYLDQTLDQQTRDNAKQYVLQALADLQATLNTVESALNIVLPLTPLDNAAIVRIGIMSQDEVNSVLAIPVAKNIPAPTPVEPSV